MADPTPEVEALRIQNLRLHARIRQLYISSDNYLRMPPALEQKYKSNKEKIKRFREALTMISNSPLSSDPWQDSILLRQVRQVAHTTLEKVDGEKEPSE